MNGDNALQRELLEEKASALARIGGVLQNTTDRLHGIRRQLESASPDERRALAQAYQLLLKCAMRYRWYLEVQREAVGIRSHRVIDSVYPIPPPFSESA
jgi:hypothetical protein